MKIQLNSTDKGEHFFDISDKGKVSFSRDLFGQIGIENLPPGLQENRQGLVALDSLHPELTYSIDNKQAILILSAKPGLFKKQTINLTHTRQLNPVETHDNSAFLNYSFQSLGQEGMAPATSLPWEIGIHLDNVFLYSGFLHAKNEHDTQSIRLMTHATRDNPGKLRRIILGDFSAYSGALGGGGLYGGLSISKHFSIDPYFVKSPELGISGILKMPSEVELYINGLLMKREHLLPGEFEFVNPPNSAGSGEITIVIRDVFGREHVITEPFYTSYSLLKSGVHEYSYNIGYKRVHFGDEDSTYTDPAIVAFHRTGISDRFTSGFRTEVDRDIVNVGIDAKFLLGSSGETDISLAISDKEDSSGQAASLGVSLFHDNLSLRMFAKGMSRQYVTLSLDENRDRSRMEKLIGIGYRNDTLGSIAITRGTVDRHIDEDFTRTTVFYTRKLSKSLSFHLRSTRTRSTDIERGIFAGLTLSLGTGKTGAVQYGSTEGNRARAIHLNQNTPLGSGIGYRLSANRLDDEEQDRLDKYNAQLFYHGSHAEYNARYQDDGLQKRHEAGIAGAISLINSSLYLSRPILDSFALVRVGKLPGVGIKHNNQPVAVTNRDGEAIVPGLISYYHNEISINDRDIPVNYSIKNLKQHVFVPYRGGGIAPFFINRIQGFTGHAYVLSGASRTPAEYWGLELSLHQSVIRTILGKGGEFYMENLAPGTYKARLYSKNRECRFSLAIPESEEMMVYLDEVYCEAQ
ncbi:MAG: fimbria/pilus outer membrane usher protein [Gammaproteobacteria bacterium]|nr:fimbria/pilus outer membrane usher protein [Gammaproteobacteria bacterium]